MGLILHTNSWVTVIEADIYLTDKPNTANWLASTQKEKYLIEAFFEIYTSPNFSIPKTSTDERVKWAQIELAYWNFKYGEDKEKREALQMMGVTSAKADDTQEDYNCKFVSSPIITGLLSDFLTGAYNARFHRKIKHCL